jgi:hypothetical protein
MNEVFTIDESRFVALPTREELLKICFDKDVVHGFLQINAYLVDGVEASIQAGITYGLIHDPGNPVSIQIAQGATKGEVLRLLSEIRRALDEDWHRLGEWDAVLRPKWPRDLGGVY